MATSIEIGFPDDLIHFELPEGVDLRLRMLLEKQDEGMALTPEEKSDAEGLVKLSESLSLLKLRAKRGIKD